MSHSGKGYQWTSQTFILWLIHSLIILFRTLLILTTGYQKTIILFSCNKNIGTKLQIIKDLLDIFNFGRFTLQFWPLVTGTDGNFINVSVFRPLAYVFLDNNFSNNFNLHTTGYQKTTQYFGLWPIYFSIIFVLQFQTWDR